MKTSDTEFLGIVPNSSKGDNLLLGVCGPFEYHKESVYSVFYSMGQRVEYCLQKVRPKDRILSLDRGVIQTFKSL